MIAVGNGQANVAQALLDAGADRYAEVRVALCLLITVHAVIVSMGYCCTSVTMLG